MRDAPSQAKGLAPGRVQIDKGAAIAEVTTDPAAEAGWEAENKKFVNKSNMPDRVESLGEVNCGKHSAICRLSMVETIGDMLREEKNLVSGGTARSEASLERGEEIAVF